MRARLASRWTKVRCARRVLPFDFSSPLTTYLYSAYPIGIIAKSGGLTGPILDRHIQLFFPASKLTDRGGGDHVRFLPGLGIYQLADLGYLGVKVWTHEQIFARSPEELIKDLAGRIAQGRYLRVYIDRFFLRHSRYFLREHSRYATLLIGVDDRTRAFTCAAYVRGVFCSASIPFHVLVESLQLEKYGVAKADMTAAVEEIEPLGTPVTKPDPELIYRQLSEYVRGIDNLMAYLPGGRFALPGGGGIELEETEGGCGTEIYPLFQEYLKKMRMDRLPIDLRATRTLMEHKLMVRLALESIASARGEQSTDCGFSRTEQLGREFHFAAFEFSRHRQPDESAALRLSALLDELRTEEKRALTLVLETW